MYCPADGKPCCDDLCRGGGRCFQLDGEEMLDRCPECRELRELSSFTVVGGACAECCDPSDWGDYDDESEVTR